MLTSEQLEAAEGVVRTVLGGEEVSLTGLAGTGKTTVTKYVYDELVKLGVPVCPMCPTAKAAMVLSKKGVPATTVHRIIYDYKGKHEFDDGNIELIFKRKGGKIHKGIFMVDESSMLTRKQVEDIRNEKIPVIWVGDPGQLPPVKSPPTGVLRCENRFHLKTIHRQAEGNPIIQFAHGLRRGEPLTKRHPGIRYVEVNGGGAERVVAEMIRAKIDVVVTKTNEQRVAVNDAYRKFVGRSGVVAPGERIICKANNKQLNVVNGEVMEVLAVEKSNDAESLIRVQSEVGWKASLWVLNSRFGSLRNGDEEYDPCVMLADYFYAGTCHSLQGSSARHVGITAKGYCGDPVPWNYTAATRAESEVTIFL